MESGIPILTDKGKRAVENLQSEISAKCRSVLVQVDGKRTLDDIRAVLKGLDGMEEGIAKLISDGYVELSKQCRDIVKGLITKQLGVKAPMLLKKLEELHTKYGESCWQHLDELDKAARLFYGESVAQTLKSEISKIIKETH